MLKTLETIGTNQMLAYEGQRQIAAALAAGLRSALARAIRSFARRPLIGTPQP